MHCRSEPQQACVPASSLRRGTPPTSTPAAGPEQLQSLQVIGGELDPARWSATDHAPRAGRAMGWVGACGRVPLVATLGRGDDDPMPTTGRTSKWTGTGTGIGVCLVTETSPDDLGVSGSMGRCPPDHDPVAGTRHHPKGVISRRPRPGTAVQHLTREAAPSALQTSAGRCSRGWVWSRRRTTLSNPTATSATAPSERTWTATSATSRTGSHTTPHPA